MTIQLNPDQEHLIGRAIQAGLIRNADDVLNVGVEAIRQRMEARLLSQSPVNPQEWSKELDAWVRSHPTTTPLLSERSDKP
jgi:hypothetical protein